VVTGIADTYDGSPDTVVMSLRDAINLANTTSGAQEIWLPAWNFVLTIERTPGSLTETSVGEGDLEVNESLTIRGVDSITRVAWRPGAAADKVFELWGDYNSNLTVDSGDYVLWSKQRGSTGAGIASDGDENGVVDNADYTIYQNHFGNTLTLLNVAV
jgi:CSLREA domain-containing protein